MKKRISTLIALILCLACVLSACGQTEPAPAETNAPAQTEAAAPAETDAAPAETEAASLVDWEDVAEVEYYYFTFVPPSDIQHIEDAINAIIEPAINTRVHLHVLEVGAYIAQMGVMIAGGEQIDLMMCGFAAASYSALMAQKQLIDLSDLIDQYGPTIKEKVGHMLPAVSMGDAIYGIPTYRNNVSSYYAFMRKDVLEDLGLLEQARNIKSVEEYEEILRAVRDSEKWGYLKPSMMGSGSGITMQDAHLVGEFESIEKWDTLGDTIGIIRMDAETGKVGLVQESESYKEVSNTAAKWNKEGLYHYDITQEIPSMEDLIKDDYIFSWIAACEFGAEEMKSGITGYPVIAVEVVRGALSPLNITSFCYAIPTTAKEPEAAVAFLNFALTNAEINNLLAWGEEGVDYQVTDGVADYIPGNEMPSYHLFDYSVPNQFLVYPWAPSAADFREQSEENFLGATASPYLGVTVDLSEISNEIAAVTTVYDEYQMQMNRGEGSDELLEEYIDKLYAAGAQKILDTYQAAVDAFMAQ